MWGKVLGPIGSLKAGYRDGDWVESGARVKFHLHFPALSYQP